MSSTCSGSTRAGRARAARARRATASAPAAAIDAGAEQALARLCFRCRATALVEDRHLIGNRVRAEPFPQPTDVDAVVERVGPSAGCPRATGNARPAPCGTARTSGDPRSAGCSRRRGRCAARSNRGVARRAGGAATFPSSRGATRRPRPRLLAPLGFTSVISRFLPRRSTPRNRAPASAPSARAAPAQDTRRPRSARTPAPCGRSPSGAGCARRPRLREARA